jgi:hypothetical protein
MTHDVALPCLFDLVFLCIQNEAFNEKGMSLKSIFRQAHRLLLVMHKYIIQIIFSLTFSTSIFY